jgi:predicted RNA-binding Zn ribbon-like protein
MDFAHYSREAAEFAAELVNTKGSVSGTEYLADVQAWREFMREYVIEGADDLTQADIEQIKVIRERIRELFFAGADDAIAKLNDLLCDVAATPHISNHDDEPWHMHFSAPGAPLAHRVGAGAAMGLAIVIVEDGYERLGVCSAEECADVFVDTSRNRSRRYCNHVCSTRMNVAAYRARHKEASAKSST